MVSIGNKPDGLNQQHVVFLKSLEQSFSGSRLTSLAALVWGWVPCRALQADPLVPQLCLVPGFRWLKKEASRDEAALVLRRGARLAGCARMSTEAVSVVAGPHCRHGVASFRRGRGNKDLLRYLSLANGVCANLTKLPTVFALC